MKKRAPLVSVVLPVYNGGGTIEPSIQSILCQTYRNIEVIVVNDGSYDGTHKICSAINDPRIVYINRPNRGLVSTLNEGLGYCRGSYIARQDADDISTPQRIETQVAFMEKNPDHIIVGSFATRIDAGGNKIGVLRRPRTAEEIFAYLPFQSPFIHGSVLFRRSIIDAGMQYEQYRCSQDYAFWHQILKHGKGYNFCQELYHYREHDSAISVTNITEQRKLGHEISLKIMREYLGEKSHYERWSFAPFCKNIKAFSRWERKHFATHARSLALLFFYKNEWKRGIKESINAQRLSPHFHDQLLKISKSLLFAGEAIMIDN
ncbi:MAG: glycosyltransferase [Chitinivibrionales bacterium]|nr:glycosyltransferase [Chitinivibrionales bacterium]